MGIRVRADPSVKADRWSLGAGKLAATIAITFHQTTYYIPSHKPSPPTVQYQIMLPDDRGKLLDHLRVEQMQAEQASPWIFIASLNALTTTPPMSHAILKNNKKMSKYDKNNNK